jgi:hypothetical protein
MSDRYAVALLQEIRGPRGDAARARLAEVLPDATVGTPDETGTFEVTLEASSRDEALLRVFDAIALAGADDEIVFEEHPDIPEHWRTGTPDAPAA